MSNRGSLKVAQKNGFRITDKDEFTNDAGVRGGEHLLKLRGRGGLRAR